MEVQQDRRRHRRFDDTVVSAKLSMIRTDQADLHLEPCHLLNISYGGICFRTHIPVEKNSEYRFLVDMKTPFQDLVLIKTRVCWTSAESPVAELAGAEFIESSKGWLGPEEE